MKEAPFKAVCINDETFSSNFINEIKIGQVVEVIDTRDNVGFLHYKIKGYEVRFGCFQWYYSANFAPIEENTYENISKELAVLPKDEVPDVKTIKELVN